MGPIIFSRFGISGVSAREAAPGERNSSYRLRRTDSEGMVTETIPVLLHGKAYDAIGVMAYATAAPSNDGDHSVR